MVVSFFITGSIKVGMAIGGFEVFTKMVLYYFHERLWFSYVSLGRSTLASSDLPLATSNQKLETRNQKPETNIVQQSYSISLNDEAT